MGTVLLVENISKNVSGPAVLLLVLCGLGLASVYARQANFAVGVVTTTTLTGTASPTSPLNYVPFKVKVEGLPVTLATYSRFGAWSGHDIRVFSELENFVITSILLVIDSHSADDRTAVFFFIDGLNAPTLGSRNLATGGHIAVEVMGAPLVDESRGTLPTSLILNPRARGFECGLRVSVQGKAATIDGVVLTGIIVSGWKASNDTITVAYS